MEKKVKKAENSIVLYFMDFYAFGLTKKKFFFRI